MAAVSDRTGALVWAAFAVILSAQVFLGLWGIAASWTRGHNGWNGAAYQNGARNTLRWGELFPLQYETANVPPDVDELYTHAPLGLHLHVVASIAVFGDREASVRGVAAFWNVAALCALFFVVRRLWGDLEGLLAAGIYVALPINAIYTNMANHSAGLIFWSLVSLYTYVRASDREAWSVPAFAGFLASFAMACAWDWPAYYVALAVALHWMVGDWRRRHAVSWHVVVFCIWVALLFLGHLALVQWATGSLDELTGTFNARRALSWPMFRAHLLVVPGLMFTWPVLGVSMAWFVFWAFRASHGRAQARDLVPVAFLIAAALHYGTFRWSAVVHSYWAWPSLPFVAISCAVSIVGIGRRVRRVASTRLEARMPATSRLFASVAAAGVGALVLVPLLLRDAQLVPEGRRVGGSMWFFTPVRGAIEPYDSGRAELRLASRIREWTDRATGVELHPSFKTRRLEPRFDVTLDRVTYRWSPRPRTRIDNRQGVDGWVFVAPLAEVPEETRVELASHHPYRQLDGYFMTDLRSDEVDIEVWESTPLPITCRWWLFHSPIEPPVSVSRSVAKEEDLRNRVEELGNGPSGKSRNVNPG